MTPTPTSTAKAHDFAQPQGILYYHSSSRVSDGRFEGVNNHVQVLRRVAHGFANYGNYPDRRPPHD